MLVIFYSFDLWLNKVVNKQMIKESSDVVPTNNFKD